MSPAYLPPITSLFYVPSQYPNPLDKRKIKNSAPLLTAVSTHILSTLPSTPPLPPPLLSGTHNTYTTPFTPAQPGFQPQYHQDQQYTDPPGSGGGDQKTRGIDTWAFNAFSSPPSPSTITSTSDSQTGGDGFPPSESGEGESSSSRSGSFRRQNLSLNISSLPAPFQNQSFQSPGSLASSGAPFTDSYTSSHNVNFEQDYFHFPDGSYSSTGEGSLAGQIPAVPQGQQPTHRLPASQPSSPIRGVYTLPFGNQAGRQRGATFSGGTFYPYDQNGSPLFTFTQNIPPQAIPPHLTFTNIQSPMHSPLAPSPVISASPAQFQTDNTPYFPLQNYPQPQGLGMQEVLMEDVSTPQPTVVPPTLSRKSSMGQMHQQTLQQSNGSMTPDISMEMVDKLSLFDKIVESAQTAKNALLRGEQADVSASLGNINHQLEIASELGVGPAPTPRDMSSNSQSVSPVNFTTSPTVPTTVSASQVMQNPIIINNGSSQMQQLTPMNAVQQQQQQGLLPSLPVDGNAANGNRSVSATPIGGNPNLMASATSSDFLNMSGNKAQAPPLVHSHSFPNGHQLPSQLQGTMTPSTPVVPSPSFIASISAQHAPIVSSPLATIPPSRAPSPPRYNIPAHAWNNEMMPAMDMSASMIQQFQQQSQMPGQLSVNVVMQSQQQQPSAVLERRASQGERADGLPISRNRSTSVHNKQWSHPVMTASVPASARQSRAGSPEDMDEDESEDEEPRKNKRRRSSAGGDGPNADLLNGAIISEDMRRQMDQMFEAFLNRVCSDLDVVDSKGEKLHQVLMAKKMQRLDESTDYRPFKFRIQAFTNAFTEELQARGISEETMSVKKIKTYLWKQDLISRFNPDGKKAKSKGNHIWNVDAKKLPGGGWVFRPFKRRIIGQPNSFALVNTKYEWEPRIWDPQAASDTIKPTFCSPPGGLPPWLHWEDSTKLVGVPDQPTGPLPVTVIADFIDGSGNQNQLETTFTIQVVPHLLPINETTAMYAQAGYIPYDFPDQPANGSGQPVALINNQGIPFSTGTMVYSQPSAVITQTPQAIGQNQPPSAFTNQQ